MADPSRFKNYLGEKPMTADMAAAGMPADMPATGERVSESGVSGNSASGGSYNPPSHTAANIASQHGNLEAGAESGETAKIAGRLMLRRVQGKVAFGTLQDSTGRIQVFAPAQSTPSFEEFCECSIGDWLEVEGEIMTTRRGELSVRVDRWQLLASTQHPFPDKWHGLADTDTRYRRRYLDLWVTEETRATFNLRSKLSSHIRRWLEDRDYQEVETPILHAIAGGAHAKPFVTHHEALDCDLYLRIAPELYLKRLVVGGMERVFEMGRVFRNEGLSPRHNPEFTLLELYAAYSDYTHMMMLSQELIQHLARTLVGSEQLIYNGRELNLGGDWRRVSMLDVIAEGIREHLSLETPRDRLVELAQKYDIETQDWWGPGKLICEIYEKTCEADLWEPTFVVDYPSEVSPLAMECPDKPGWTQRFELIIAGREVANAFSELVDPGEQRSRFEAQNANREHGDVEAMLIDEDYLRALEYGMPPTGGLGIGIDRLVALLADCQSLRDVLLFPTLRPED